MTLFQGSRYEETPLFEPDASGRTRFRGLRARDTGTAVGVLEHRITATDRLDRLAYHYYGDSRGWHRLAEANADVLFPEDLLAAPADPRATEPHSDERLGRTVLIPGKRGG